MHKFNNCNLKGENWTIYQWFMYKVVIPQNIFTILYAQSLAMRVHIIQQLGKIHANVS